MMQKVKLVALLGVSILAGCTAVVEDRRACDPEDDFCPEGFRCDGSRCVRADADGDADADIETDRDVENDRDVETDRDVDNEADIEGDADTDGDGEACEEGQKIPCGTNEGICEEGTRTCGDGAWGACEGSVEPLDTELCNRLDDDCDEAVDEDCDPPSSAVARFPWNGYTTGSPHATEGVVDPLRPSFRWEEAEGALDYELQVDDSCPISDFDDCTFPSPAIATYATETTFTPDSDLEVDSDPPVGRRYYWRVRACNGATCSDWTDVRYVDVGRSSQDYNGDGYSDVAVGAYRQRNDIDFVGVAFVFSGTSGGIDADHYVALDNPAGIVPGWFGTSVASVGDVNGDGFSDLMVGASRNDNGSWTKSGRAYVYHGSEVGITGSVATKIGNPAEGPGGGDNPSFGDSIASAGDVNGDGFADVLVGASGQDGSMDDEGRVYLYYGALDTGIDSSRPVALSNPTVEEDGRFGYSVASAGDVNGDGFVDAIVGTPAQLAAYLYYGSNLGITTTPITLDAPRGDGDSWFGGSVSSAGDVNGDGFSDLLVGAKNRDAVYFYYGSRARFPADLTPALELENPTDQSGRFGLSISPAGDVNGDGFSDVIVGAPLQANPAENEGNAFVFYGSRLGFPSDGDPRTFDSPDSAVGGWFGLSVSSAGDVNGDGLFDVIIGTGLGQDTAYVFQGSTTGFPARPSPAASLSNPRFDPAGPYSCFGCAVASAADHVPPRDRHVGEYPKPAACLPQRDRRSMNMSMDVALG